MQTELLDLELGGQKNDVDIDGWYIGASWFITGEKKSPKKGKFGRLTPKNRFNPTEGKFGAFELVARVEKFDLDSDLIKKGFGTGSDQVDVFAVGLNWYLNNMVLIRLNYLHNSFDDKLGRLKDDNEDVFLSRFQVEF